MIKKITNKSNKILLFKTIDLNRPISILVGGNGAGKTTLLNTIYDKSTSIEITGDFGELVYYRNSKDNFRYEEPAPWESDFLEKIVRRAQSVEYSEGENVVDSFLHWINSNYKDFCVFLIDELDSGLSLSPLNGICHVINHFVTQYNCQFIISSNNWHWSWVYPEYNVSVIDGKLVAFNKDYSKYCEFNFNSAEFIDKKRSKRR